jgi:hypothetical protein
MLTALRLLNVLIWTGLLLYMLPSARHAVTGRDVRRADPWRLSVAVVSIVIILGNLRWLMAPDNALLFGAVYVLTAMVGIYKIILARTYGRGPKL